MQITIRNTGEVNSAARQFADQMGDNKIFAFYGPMGAGKTTLIKAICRELGSIDTATSPSFTLVNEYMTDTGVCLYHFDFFRIKEPEEAYDFGFEEYLQSGSICFIEWPERIEGMLPAGTVKIYITEDEDGSRKVIF